jgi:hypothetical protein
VLKKYHDRLAVSVKYSHTNLYFTASYLRLKINWRRFTVLHSLTCLTVRGMYSRQHIRLYTLYGQQHDRLVQTVKYSQSNLYFILKWIRLKIYWWSLTVWYCLRCFWLYFVSVLCQRLSSFIMLYRTALYKA